MAKVLAVRHENRRWEYEAGTLRQTTAAEREKVGVRAYHKILHRLCEAQSWRCCYCGTRMVLYPEAGPRSDRASIEHVEPRGFGGSDEWENLVAACKLCNHARGSMSADWFLLLVGWHGREKACAYGFRREARRMGNRTKHWRHEPLREPKPPEERG